MTWDAEREAAVRARLAEPATASLGLMVEAVRNRADLAAALDELERLRALLDRLVDNDACWFDHHGLCQSHGLDPQPCPSATAQELLRAFGVRRG